VDVDPGGVNDLGHGYTFSDRRSVQAPDPIVTTEIN